VVEDAVDLLGLGDESDYTHLFTASGTRQGLDFEERLYRIDR